MFVNTHLLSPVVHEGVTRAPKGSREWLEFWREEERRCLQGYSVAGTTITGRHYHYLNYWKILAENKKTGTKRRMPPRFLDIDHEFYWQVENCIKEGKDGLWLKRRQAGYTFKTGHLGGYAFTFIPDSHTIITAGLDEFADYSFRSMLYGLDQAFGTPFYRNRQDPNEKAHIKAQYKVKEVTSGHEFYEGYMGEVQKIPSGDKQSLIGKSPYQVVYEEIGKFPGFLDVKAYIDPGMRVGGRKTGFSWCIGTGGDGDSSIDELEEAFYRPEKYGFMAVDNIWDEREDVIDDAPAPESEKTKVCFFVPAYKFDVVDADGNSDIEASLEQIQRRREAKKGTRNYQEEVTQFPITPREALMVADGGVFNQGKLRARKAEILRDIRLRDLIVRGELNWEYSGGQAVGVSWKDNPEGRFHRVEPPYKDKNDRIPEGLYVAGTDSYDINQVSSGEGSLGSCYMMKTFYSVDTSSNIPVCRITERPPTASEFWEDTLKMCIYYGNAQNLIEYSNKLIGEYYIRKGYAHLLRQRPEIAYATQSKVGPQNRWGLDPTAKPFAIRKLQDYVEEYSHLLVDLHTIEKLIRYRHKLPNGGKYNCDDTIALSLAVVHAQDRVADLVGEQPEEEAFLGLSYTMSGGRIVRSGW